MTANNYGQMPGRYPAIVQSYDQDRRTCRIEIPGITDGADVFPEAEIEYPIGDKARSGSDGTEIEILPGDTIWIAFIGGDSRYPIITGYRNPQAGNSIDWRRFHHANIEFIADGMMRLNAETVEINAANVIVNGDTAVVGSSLTHNSKNVGSTHRHDSVQSGSDNTGSPV
ncbi:hypothetical protein [Nitrosomonas supralitoralis]|uniref:Phage baseplate assembly protein V n=1 Tax=Nitrosomonas supralitoralis TaxID=2116706 RepID=A0A2P7NRH8_9PROT|nr:hypothetical protein [Nitrosomonas supralitoralis]PSJ16073.1 hypothetical protein C7H79_15450 [Nitrosomonas supralitoralis]